MMKQSFPSIVDANFTANMEGLLDMVEEGKVPWKEVIRNFYPDLKEAVDLSLIHILFDQDMFCLEVSFCIFLNIIFFFRGR